MMREHWLCLLRDVGAEFSFDAPGVIQNGVEWLLPADQIVWKACEYYLSLSYITFLLFFLLD